MKSVAEKYSTYLGKRATSMAQAYSDRDTFVDMYMGQNSPTKNLVLFGPLLWEATALFCYCLKMQRNVTQLYSADQIDDIVAELVYDATTDDADKDKLLDRIQQYKNVKDLLKAFGAFCTYCAETAMHSKDLEEAKLLKNSYGNFAEAIKLNGSAIVNEANLDK